MSDVMDVPAPTRSVGIDSQSDRSAVSKTDYQTKNFASHHFVIQYSLSPRYANIAVRRHSRNFDFRVSRISRLAAKILLINNIFLLKLVLLCTLLTYLLK